MAKVKATGKAMFTRSMYPGVSFCERCFCHHNQAECPFPLTAFNPAVVELEDMPGYRAKESA